MEMEKIEKVVNENKERYLKEMEAYVRIKSVSGDSSLNGETRRCAEYTAKLLEGLGAEKVELMETGGHPVPRGHRQDLVVQPRLRVRRHPDRVAAGHLGLRHRRRG